jgi:putative ABC transport system substrate-binding protein
MRIRRREFITLLGGAAVVLPLAAHAQQQAGKLPTIGYLSVASAATAVQWRAAFVQRLYELGWIEGRTVAIEYRYAEGRRERFSEIAAEFVRLKVDVIVTTGNGAAAAKEVTSVIPIVFSLSNDPVGGGLVASLARPSGNVTGLSSEDLDLPGKRIEISREIVPGLRRLAILADVGQPSTVAEMSEAQTAAAKLGLEVVTLGVRRLEDIAPALEAIKGRADALYICGGVFQTMNQLYINTLALASRLPTILGAREDAEEAGLMSYGPNLTDLFRRAGDYVDKILRGAKPADLPVEQPTKFELVINLKTARALGLVVPPLVLTRADEVIE